MFDKIAAEDPEEAEFLPDLENGRVTITITSGEGGRLDRLVVEIRETTDGEQSVDTGDLHFANWGEPVSITAPSADAIDHTPAVDEEDLAAFDKFQILARTALPAGWELQSAGVTKEDAEFEECTSVDFTYGPPFDWSSVDFEDDDGPMPTIAHVSMTDAACQWIDDYVVDAADARAVRFGPYRGHVADPGDAEDVGTGFYAYGRLASTTVVADLPGAKLVAGSNAGEQVLLDLLATLAPYLS